MYILSKVINFMSYIADNLGTLFNRVVECCKRKSKPTFKTVATNFVDLNGHNLSTRNVKHENKIPIKKTRYEIIAEENNKRGIQTIEISGSSPQEIIKNYISDYQGDINPYPAKRIVFSTGYIDSSGTIHRLETSTFIRLQKTGLCYKLNRDGKDRIILPLLGVGKFELFDKFGWCKSNSTIQKRLKTIADAHRVMLLLLRTTRKKIELFGLKEKISDRNAENITALPKHIKTEANKEKLPLSFSNNRSENTKQRLRNKLAEKKDREQKETNDQKEVLDGLGHFEKLLTGLTIYSDVYPNKINAYMLFENLCNNFSDITIFMSRLFSNAYLKTELLDHCEHQHQIFRESLELLLPYATEITKAFHINIIDDSICDSLTKLSQKASGSAIAELKEHWDIERKLAMLVDEVPNVVEKKKQKVKKTGNKKKPKKSIAKASSKHEDNSITLDQTDQTLVDIPQIPEELLKPVTKREVIDLSHLDDQTVDLDQLNDQKMARKAELERERSRLIARHEKNEAKAQRIAERKAIQAKEVVSKYKQEQNKQKEAEQRERQRTQVKIHELPSEELVWNTILPGLKGNHSYIEMMFGQEENHIQMSHKHVVNLAQALRNALKENDISCADDLYNNVIARIHHRHDGATGDLLPRHYVDILRSCFIIFGIFPKDWEPKTEEDFDAMEKYYQRQLDYFYWESKL